MGLKGLIVGDLHICDSTPLKRIDNFLEVQFEKIRKIKDFSEEFEVDYVFLLGDVFDKSRIDARVLNSAASIFKKFPCRIYSLIGNHDLQGCRNGLEGTSLGTLFTTDILTKIAGDFEIINVPFRAINYTNEHTLKLYETEKPRIILSHGMVTPQIAPFEHIYVDDVLKSVKDCFVFSGHFHYPFEKYNPITKSRVVNPGVINRTSISEKEVDPSIIYFEATPSDLVTTYRKISLGASAGDEVFDVALHEEIKSNDLNLKDFIESITKTQFESQDLEALVQQVGLENKVDKNVIEEATNRIKIAKTLS